MLEAYWSFADFGMMADLVPSLICLISRRNFSARCKLSTRTLKAKSTVSSIWHVHGAGQLTGIWSPAWAGPDWFDLDDAGRRARCETLGVEISAEMEDHEVTQQVFEKLVEEKSFDPVFVTHVPKELVPLARQNVADPSVVDVYELIINGVEIVQKRATPN